MKVKVYHNGDDVFIAWKPQGIIPDCRGFALFRRRNGIEEIVSTWVGFEGQKPKKGERRASTNWPIQKYQWTDYMAAPGDAIQYRVVPIVGPSKDSLQVDHSIAMVHSKVILIGPIGKNPILMTGSHNLGPKASRTNDENLLIFRNARGLARAYATNIMAVYNQYRWRFRREKQPISKRSKGLKDSDSWQKSYLAKGSAALREIDFWANA